VNEKKAVKGIIFHPDWKWLAIILILAAFVCALWINLGLRAPVEADDRTVGLFVDYDELKRIADTSSNMDFPGVLRNAWLAGATGLVVRERLLAEWEIAGDIIVLAGGQMQFQLESQLGGVEGGSFSDIEIVPNKTYILTKDTQVYEQLYAILGAKKRDPEPFDIPGYLGIATNLHSSERATLGMGFPMTQLEQAAAIGFDIIPRLRNWEPITKNSLEGTFRWVKKIPNLAAIGFNDQTIPGDDGMDPDLQELLADVINPLNVPMVSFEFYTQDGLTELAELLDINIMRAHAISENEMPQYTQVDDAVDRYNLAATERNIRYIYVRFQGLINPANSIVNNMALIVHVREGIESEGLSIGNPEPMPVYTISPILLFVIGAGALAAGGWLLILAFESLFAKKKWRIVFCVIMGLGLIGWAGGLLVFPIFARKLFSFASAIVFPCLSVVLILKNSVKASPLPDQPETKKALFPERRKRLLRAIAQLLVISAFTLVGAMVMSSLLAEPLFMLKVDTFVGVKAAHIIPLALIPIILWLREQDWYGLLSGKINGNVRFWHLGVGVVLLIGVMVYVQRTGNDNPNAVSGIELTVRRTLNSILGVRPRTTEFLIGHPLMLVLLYYGYRFDMFPVLMIGLMGQASLLNTYAHLHTPVIVSLQRSGLGLCLGIVIGVIYIVIIEAIFRRVKIVNAKRAGLSFSEQEW